MSCGRRTDPDRSFCTRCGSAVFVDDRDPALQRIRTFATIDTGDDAGAGSAPARRPQPPAARGRQQQQRLREQMRAREAASVAGLGSALWSLIKIGIFLYLAYWAYDYARTTPEIRRVIEQVQREGDIKPAIDYLRERFEAVVEGPVSAPELRRDDEPRRLEQPPSTNAAPNDAAPIERTTAVGNDTVAAPAPASADSELPRVVRRVSPAYTEEALRRRIEGTVRLRANVNEDGTVASADVIRSLDSEYGLDASAVAALRQWIFEPPRRGGVPTRAIVQVDMNFTLR
jgi:protein TonB